MSDNSSSASPSGPVVWEQVPTKSLPDPQQIDLLRFLRAGSLFDSLSETALRAALTSTWYVRVDANQILFAKGDPGDSFYLIVEGCVQVVREAQGDLVVLAELEEGDGFGEKSLLDGSPRTATLRTRTPCTLLRLMADDYTRLCAENPEVYAQMQSMRQSRVSALDASVNPEQAAQVLERLQSTQHLELDPATLELLLRLNEAAGGKGQNEHCKETAILAREMSRLLCPGLSEAVFYGGYLHEIGKIGLPTDLIARQRRGELLTEAEQAQYNGIFRNALRIIKPDGPLHHALYFLEAMDRKHHSEMPVEAQIVLCAHEYLEKVSPHYQNRSATEGLESIRSESGERFNPSVVRTLEQMVDKFSNLQVSKQLRFIRQMNIALDVKDNYTLRHSYHVRVMALKIGDRMRLERRDMNLLHLACDMHDVGKIFIPPEILNAPRALTPEEFDVMKQHPVYSAEFFADMPGMRELQSIVRHHHERFDGKGYPDGLKGEEIPLMSRIEVIADVWSALTTPRVYRVGKDGRQQAYGADEALSIMNRMQPGHFDPEIFRLFGDLVADQAAMQGSDWSVVEGIDVNQPRY